MRDGRVHDVDRAAIVDGTSRPAERHRPVGVGAPAAGGDDAGGVLVTEHPSTGHEVLTVPDGRSDDRSSTHDEGGVGDRVHGHRVGDDLELERNLLDRGLGQLRGGQPPARPDPVVATPERANGSGARPGVLEQVDRRVDGTLLIDRGEHGPDPHVLVRQRRRGGQRPTVDHHDRGNGLTGDGGDRVAQRRRGDIGVDRHVGVAVW